MALLVPDVGEARLLANALNKATPANQTLKLFVNDVTPGESDTAATYTAAAGGGYADKTLTGSSWTVASVGGVTTASYAEQVFTFTGVLTTNPTIYGYFVVDAADGVLLWAERAGSTFVPTNNGDTYKVTPAITQA
jgi:hypothetical protein